MISEAALQPRDAGGIRLDRDDTTAEAREDEAARAEKRSDVEDEVIPTHDAGEDCLLPTAIPVIARHVRQRFDPGQHSQRC